MKIKMVQAREVLDSRGNPTVSAAVHLTDGSIGEAVVPSGASTGSEEAFELRDNNSHRFNGMGVLDAVENVNKRINHLLKGRDASNQNEIDAAMIKADGTANKSNLGANAILAVSLACAKAESISRGLELFEYLNLLYGGDKIKIPTPMFNVLNGGKHAANKLDVQETMIVPVGFKSFSKKLQAGTEIYHFLKNELYNKGYSVGLGDEGGFAPELSENEAVLKLVSRSIEKCGYTKKQVRVSLDIAASEFFEKKEYHLKAENKYLSSKEMIKKVAGWVKKYELLSVEDGLAESDTNWKEFTQKIGKTISVGDDLFVTNPEKISFGAKEHIANGVIIKPNQIGTLSETLEAIRNAKIGKMTVIVSHRSGETEDSFIADLAAAVGADFIKSGAPARSERLAKYNRLLKIEEILGGKN